MDPYSIEEYKIYDIFHNEQLVIITPLIDPHLEIQYMGSSFNCNECPDNHTRIYFLTTDYKEEIELQINGSSIKTRVNKYPEFKDEIIFSTLVKN